jgi:hypothetical protein
MKQWLYVPVLLVALTVATPASAYEFNPYGWPKPSLSGAIRYKVEQIDLDPAVEGKETKIERFNTPDGGRVFRLSHNGHVFSYRVDHDRVDPMDYEILDRNGSGLFEIRRWPEPQFPLPPWTMEE